MANTNINNNDYVEFIIKTPYGSSRKVSKGPDGWDEEGLELDRHKTYHGIVTEFIESLIFYDEDADYLYNGYVLGGINVNCYMLKRSRRNVDGEIKLVDDYLGIADFKKYERGENYLKINFNSHNLEEIIKSHEGDDFEMERTTSIDGDVLDEAVINTIGIEGRTLYSTGASKLLPNGIGGPFIGSPTCNFILSTGGMGTATTVLTSRGPERHSSVDSIPIELSGSKETGDYFGQLPGNSFFPNSQVDSGVHQLDITYDIQFSVVKPNVDIIMNSHVEVFFGKFKYHVNGNKYKLVENTVLYTIPVTTNKTWNVFKGRLQTEVQYDELLAIVFSNPNGAVNYDKAHIEVNKHNIKVNSISFFNSSPSLKFMFVSDIYKRLLQIMTGGNNRFYSKYFGKVEDGYELDGEAGLIGVISSWWVRAFDRASDKYKSLTMSLKDLFESTDAMFNLGAMIENKGFEERFRVEEKEFFYQPKVVIVLPYVVEEKETLDDKMFFSAVEVGFEKGGEYESTIGLDEPNIKSNYVTPIRKSATKYVKLSKIAGDETGLELTRRKPAFLFPEEDTGRDDDNWFLDAKRTVGTGFAQKIWSDRLVEVPRGVHDPTNFKSFFFTPFRMMQRHGSIIVAGMTPYREKFVKYISSLGNVNLVTWFIGEERAYAENEQELKVKELGYQLMTPEIVKFEHALDQDLIDLIKGKTQAYYQGSLEDIPNAFFKFEWRNTRGEIRNGFMLNIKLKSEGEFTMQISNNDII